MNAAPVDSSTRHNSDIKVIQITVEMLDAIKQNMPSLFKELSIQNPSLFEEHARTKSRRYTNVSQAPYYRREYALYVQPYADSMLKGETNVLLPLTDYYGSKPRTHYLRVKQGFFFLMDHMDTESKDYTMLHDRVDFMVESYGVRIKTKARKEEIKEIKQDLRKLRKHRKLPATIEKALSKKTLSEVVKETLEVEHFVTEEQALEIQNQPKAKPGPKPSSSVVLSSVNTAYVAPSNWHYELETWLDRPIGSTFERRQKGFRLTAEDRQYVEDIIAGTFCKVIYFEDGFKIVME